MTSSAKLLVIDDEPAVLKLVKSMLNRARYEVSTCASGTEALRLIEDGAFDCIITDAVMPVMTGYDLVRAIRKHPQLSELPVLMLTRKRHRQDVKRAVEVGVSDYVLKPIDEHLLLDKVELCLRKGGGKRHIFELTMSGEAAKAQITMPCEVSVISESDICLRVPLQLTPEHAFDFRIPVFEQLGIAPPILKFVRCELMYDPLRERKDLRYEARFTFVGVPEADLRKIRAWLQKEEIRRRK
jgi:two-component system chemotaxis response regulator CheY